jgi:putative transposase
MRNRKANRMKGYDYSNTGMYFVTICVRNRFENHNIFGEIVDGKMRCNECGKIVLRQWVWLSKQYPYVQLNEFVIMPDHFHGIIGIMQKTKPLDQLIGAFKTTSSKMIHQGGNPDFRWQKSYYDRIIRNGRELFFIREYIRKNPVNHERATGLEPATSSLGTNQSARTGVFTDVKVCKNTSKVKVF